MAKEKKEPRKQIMKVTLEVMIPRDDETGNVDILATEGRIYFNTSTPPSKMMGWLKPQLIDTLQKARDHEPSVMLTNKTNLIGLDGEKLSSEQKSKLILPE